MTIRVDVPDRLFAEIAGNLGMARHHVGAADLVFEALALFNCAAQRRRRGLVLVVAGPDGPQEVVTTPLLSKVVMPAAGRRA